MQSSMTMPPGLEFLARGRAEPFMSVVGSPPAAAHSAVIAPPDSEEFSSLKIMSKELAEEVRQSVALDLDVKVAERLESVWEQGQQAARQFLVESRTFNEELAAQVADFQHRQAALELENMQLQQMLTGVLGQLAAWGSGALNGAPLLDMQNLCKAVAPLAEISPDGSSTRASDSTGSVSPALTFESPPAVLTASSDHSSSSGASEGMWDFPTGNMPKLPEVPAFPFPPTTPQVSSTPLSLVDALGIDEAETPVLMAPTLSDMLELSPTTPVFTPFAAEYATDYAPEVFSPYPLEYATDADVDTDGFVFSITIRKAEGTSFGLATSSSGRDEGALRIEGVLPGGAAEAWNRQCSSSGAAEKVLLPGDVIVSVNCIGGNCEDMKLECERQTLLRLMVVRSDGPRSAPPQHIAAVTERCEFSTLRADASEFIPTGFAACAEY